MARYARLDGNAVVEIMDLPEGTLPADAFHPELAATLRACGDDVEPGWAYEGEAFAPPSSSEVDLQDLKARLKAAVDVEAEAERAKHITPGAGQAMTYQQKAAEAVMLEDDQSPDPASYPMLAAEVGITAGTLAEVGVVVRQAHAQWIVLGAQIEAARLGAKKAINDATDADSARAASLVSWPS